MIHRFSLLTHAKSSKIVLSGELANSSPLAFAEGLFVLYKLFFQKRRIFNLKSRIMTKIVNVPFSF